MKHRYLVSASLSFVFATGLLNQCSAQDQPPKTNFSIVITRPTGNNGYEELVMATDVLRTSKEANTASGSSDLTLRQKRDILAIPVVQRALDLITAGLNKPVSSPREQMDENTVFPELAGFRQLSRILMMKLYVELADGRVSSAIDTLRTGLSLGYAIQFDTLIGGLVGIAIDGIMLKRSAMAVDQASVKDCNALISLARQWMALPDPAIKIFEAEKFFETGILKKHKNNVNQLASALLDAPGTPDNADLKGQLLADPQGTAAAVDSAVLKVEEHFDYLISELKKPMWQRKIGEIKHDNSLGGKLAELITPVTSRVNDRFAQDQAMVQLLGVHAAIRKYRWENDKLPNSLEEMKLGDLAVDPFNGKLLSYKRIDDRTFELYSIGPVERDDAGMETGSRKRVSLQPG